MDLLSLTLRSLFCGSEINRDLSKNVIERVQIRLLVSYKVE